MFLKMKSFVKILRKNTISAFEDVQKVFINFLKKHCVEMVPYGAS